MYTCMTNPIPIIIAVLQVEISSFAHFSSFEPRSADGTVLPIPIPRVSYTDETGISA